MSTSAAPTADARVAWFAQECRRNGVRIDACVRSAERAGDQEMAAFFRRAQPGSRAHGRSNAMTVAPADTCVVARLTPPF
jgi:hypothetical protein